MGKHHDELALEFELLIGMQKELKQSFEHVQTTWQNKNEFAGLMKIDQWEIELIDRIRQTATKARTAVHEIMTKNLADIHRRLDQLAFDMEQRQEEGNYLDNDIAEVKKQLEQLNNNLKNVHEKIRINQTATNNIDWDSLIDVIPEKKSSANRFSLSDYPENEGEEPRDKLWSSFRKFIRSKHFNIDYRNRQSSLKRSTTSVYEPVVVAFISPPTSDVTQFDSFSSSESPALDHSSTNTRSNDESCTPKKNFLRFDRNTLLPQASDV